MESFRVGMLKSSISSLKIIPLVSERIRLPKLKWSNVIMQMWVEIHHSDSLVVDGASGCHSVSIRGQYTEV